MRWDEVAIPVLQAKEACMPLRLVGETAWGSEFVGKAILGWDAQAFKPGTWETPKLYVFMRSIWKTPNTGKIVQASAALSGDGVEGTHSPPCAQLPGPRLQMVMD